MRRHSRTGIDDNKGIEWIFIPNNNNHDVEVDDDRSNFGIRTM